MTDTDPEVQRVQMELARRKSPAEKIAQVREMTDLVVRLSRRAIARANPGMTIAEVMGTQKNVLDRPYLAKWAAEVGVADLLTKAWKETEA